MEMSATVKVEPGVKEETDNDNPHQNQSSMASDAALHSVKVEAPIKQEALETEQSEEALVSGAGTATTSALSKRQQRKQNKIKEWEATKHLRKEKRKQKKIEIRDKKKQKLEALKAEAAKLGLELVNPSPITHTQTRKKLKSNQMKNSSCKVGVCIDMSFDHLMIDKDIHKCVKQLHRCYSINRRYENPLQFHITGFTGKSVEAMKKNDGWRNWDIHFSEKSYLELDSYPKEKIVYLTAESENILMEPEDSTLYVIGGLVDHNSLKGLCHKLAVEKWLRHARLPLDDYIQMSSRKVLNIVHVFEILGGVAHKRPWSEVLMEVLPQRAQPKLKEAESNDESSSGSDNDDNDNCEESSTGNEMKCS